MGDLTLQLQFEDETDSFLDSTKIAKNLLRILPLIAPSFLIGIELDILITDDLTMKGINTERRGLLKTTDVLSFPLFHANPPIPYQMIGEIVISMDTLQLQAREIGHREIDEFYRLLVHGVLHLFGYDHETNEFDAIAMRKKEDECLELIFENQNGA